MTTSPGPLPGAMPAAVGPGPTENLTILYDCPEGGDEH